MNEIFGLLNINAEIISNIDLQARDISNNAGTNRILRNAEHSLKGIQEMVSSTATPSQISQQSVNEVVDKMKADAKNGGGAEWTPRELRVVSYYMMRFQNSQTEFRHALDLLRDNWRDMFFNGLVFFLLDSWNTCSDYIRRETSSLVCSKLQNYTGGINKYIQLKNHANFFEDDGPLRMATLVIHKQMRIEEAPKLLGYNSSNFSLQFFSDVIINYIKQQHISDVVSIEKIFDNHKLDRTKKIAMAYLINTAAASDDSIKQDLACHCTRRVLGSDISLESTWAGFTGATPEEKQSLKNAFELVNVWYARKIIEAFFEVACQDPRRRKFWIKYVDNVRDFRIVGSTATKATLLSDGRVANSLLNHFIETNSRISTTAALILYFKGKVFVEFSDVGALYIYNETNPAISLLKKVRSIENTKDLKSPGIGSAIDQESGFYGSKYYIHYNEGRVTHQGEWEVRLASWLKEKLQLEPKEKRRKANEIPTESPVSLQYSNDNQSSQTSINSPQPVASSHNDADRTNDSKQGPLPGTEVSNITPITKSKWLFAESCRLVIDKDKLYLYMESKKRYYYLSPVPEVSNIKEYSIWVPTKSSASVFSVVLSHPSKCNINVGEIYKDNSDIIFQPLFYQRVKIHIS